MDEDDKVLAAAIRYLVDNNDYEAASYLVLCDGLKCISGQSIKVVLSGAPILVKLFVDKSQWGYRVTSTNWNYEAWIEGSIQHRIEMALMAALGLDECGLDIQTKLTISEVDANWRTELQEEIRGRRITNQGVEFHGDRVVTWKNLKFRSQSEIRIADALDKAGVFFLPNCRGRLNSDTGGRANKEADFLICHNGKWGIVEVDSDVSHPPTRTVQDHERDRLFKRHGIRVVEHFDAPDCFENAAGVVQKFLDILDKS